MARIKKKARINLRFLINADFLFINAGHHLLSLGLKSRTIIGRQGLTTGFGMGPGVTPNVW